MKNLLRMSPAPALQTQPEPLRRGCDTDVAASVESLFRLIPSPEEQRELCRSDYILQMPGLSWKICFSMTSNTPDYSDYDGYDELYCCSDVCGGVDPTYYAPTDMEFMHELYGPDNCGVYCQLWYEIRSYGHCAQQTVSFPMA